MIRPLVATLALCAAGTALAELPQVRDAHVVQPPPGAPVAAGYLTLTNTTDVPLVIDGASSPTVGRVELHRTTIVDDVARMREQRNVTVSPGATLTLERGGYHLMLMEIGDGLAAGDDVVVVLDTSAGALELRMPVRAPDASPSHGRSTADEAARDGAMHGDGAHDGPAMRHDAK